MNYPVLTPEALKTKESPVNIDLPPEVRRRMELLYYVVMVVNPSNHSAHVRTRRKPVPPLAQSGSDAKYVATTADLFPLVDKVKVHPVELQPSDSPIPPRLLLNVPELFVPMLVVSNCTLQLSVAVSA